MQDVSVRLAAAAILAVSLAATVHAAAATAASSDQLEEVVVTARYTAESAQRAPIAISTIGSEQIEARGIEQVADVGSSIPNVTFVPAPSNMGKGVTAFVRGIGQVDSSFAFNPAVGFYLDDVYLGAMTGSNLDLVDIDGVDVLRGPQGTLFGANTESGAIRIHTTKPKGDDSGYASLSYGSYRHVRMTGGFDVPLRGDNVFLRVSAVSDKQTGYQKVMDFACLYPALAGTLPRYASPVTGCQLGTQGGTDSIGGRAALRWVASDSVEVNLAADVTNDTGETPATALVALNPGPVSTYNSLVVVPSFGVPLDARFIPAHPFISYNTSTDPASGQIFGPLDPLLNYGYSATIDWKTSNNMQVKSVSAYRNSSGAQPFSNSQAPIITGISDQHTKRHQFSEELSLTGKAFGDKLDWAVGAFYYKADANLQGEINLRAVTAFFPAHLQFLVQEHISDTNKSAFVHFNYQFTPELSLELGLRHTDLSKTFTIKQAGVPGAFGFPLPGIPVDQNAKRNDPKIGLQYQWTPDFMTYVSYATGFKGGGVNPYVVLLPSEATPFGPESVKSYELGAKSEWLDRHLRVNAAIFQMDYNDLQEQINLPTLPFPIHVNVGNARLKGVEVEVEARAGNFSLNGSASYLDYKTINCFEACVSANRGGTIPDNGVAPLTPKSKFNIGLQYAIQSGSGTFTPRLDYAHQSKVFFDTSNDPRASQAGYGVANLHLLWEAPDNKWSAQATVSNLSDETYYTTMGNYLGALGSLTGSVAPPREWLLTVKRKF
jgi:iron complex outermembrane receptor protein